MDKLKKILDIKYYDYITDRKRIEFKNSVKKLYAEIKEFLKHFENENLLKTEEYYEYNRLDLKITFFNGKEVYFSKRIIFDPPGIIDDELQITFSENQLKIYVYKDSERWMSLFRPSWDEFNEDKFKEILINYIEKF